MVFGLPGHKTDADTRRNEYTSLKKNVRQAHTPSLAETQRNNQMDETINQHFVKMSSPHLDLNVQRSSEELSTSSKFPIKMDVCVKIVPIAPKTKNKAEPTSYEPEHIAE